MNEIETLLYSAQIMKFMLTMASLDLEKNKNLGSAGSGPEKNELSFRCI